MTAIFKFWKYFSGSGKAPSRSGKTPKSRGYPQHAARPIAKVCSLNPSGMREYLLLLKKTYAHLRQSVVQSNPFTGSGLRDAHASVHCPLLIWRDDTACAPPRRMRGRQAGLWAGLGLASRPYRRSHVHLDSLFTRLIQL